MPQDILDECEEFSEEVIYLTTFRFGKQKHLVFIDLKLWLKLSTLQLHWHLNKFYQSKPLDLEQLPRSVGHFFEEQIEAFLDREKDEDKLKLKRGFCDWFLKWELVDTGVSNLKNQVQTVIC